MNSTIAASFFAAVAIFAGSIAYAAPDAPDTVSVKVNIADLNLETRAGAHTMLERLKAATRNICGPAPRPVDIGAMSAYHACFDETLTGSVKAAGSPLVSEAFEESKGRPSALALAKASN